MKVEVHLHTDRYSACSVAAPDELMAELVALGYEAVYITEHNTLWSDGEIAQLQAAHPQLRIFPGVELTISDEPLEHLLVLGTTDREYLRIDDPADVLDKARSAGDLTILAHPFRFDAGAALVSEQHLLPDALEYCSCNQPPQLGEYAERLAAEHGLALVNAGDTAGARRVLRERCAPRLCGYRRYWRTYVRSLVPKRLLAMRRQVLGLCYRIKKRAVGLLHGRSPPAGGA